MRETKPERLDVGTPQRACSAHGKACTQGLGLLYLKLGLHTSSTAGGHLNFPIRISMPLSMEKLGGHLASSSWRLYFPSLLLAQWSTAMCIRLDYLSTVEYPVGASLCCGMTDRYCQICPFCQTTIPVWADGESETSHSPSCKARTEAGGCWRTEQVTFRLRSWTPARGWVTSIFRKTL